MKKLITLCLCGFLVLGCSSTTNKKDDIDSNKDKTEEKNGKKTSKKEENKDETETDESMDSSENAVKENKAITNETNSSTSTNQSATGNNSNSSTPTITPESNNSESSNGNSNSGASNGNGNAGTETTNPPIEDTNYCMYLDLGVGNSGMSFSSIADSDAYLSETVFNPNSPHYLQHFTYRDHGCNPDGSKRYSIDWL